MIRNIVFDMGNVLLDYSPLFPCIRHCQDEQKAVQVCNALFGDPSWGPMIDGGVLTEEEYLEEAQKRLPTQELRDMAAAVMSDWWLDALYPKSGMDKLTSYLLQEGYKLYVLSNCGFRFSDFTYKIANIDRFSGRIISAHERMLKPHADIYARLCEKYDLVADECLFVDDLQANIDGAEAAGIHGYCFADGDVSRLRAYLDALEKQ